MSSTGSAAPQIEPEILRNLGEMVVISSYLERLVGDLFSAMLTTMNAGGPPDPGSLLVVTQGVSPSTLTDWIRSLLKARPTSELIEAEVRGLLKDADEVRKERNALVHGLWGTGKSPPATVMVQTVRIGNDVPIRDQLVSASDLHTLIDEMLYVAERFQTFLHTHGLPHHRR